MWFGTLSGLFRYDTRTLTPYQAYLGDKKLFADLRDILCDSRGRIWIGTTSKLTLYNPGNAEITHFKLDSADAN